MNKTQTRLVELSNELQDIAAKYEEIATAPPPIEGLSRNQLALQEFKEWLHKEGYVYTRGVEFCKIKDIVQTSMKNMTGMITELQKQNGMLLAGVDLHNPPEALTQTQSTEIDDGQPIDFTDIEDEEDGIEHP